MKIVLEGETSLVLLPVEGQLTIEAESAKQQYTPFHMLGSALAGCTFEVLQSWANHARLDVSDLKIRVEWDFAESPHRASALRTSITWPSLPEDRLNAARRAADLCGVHATLSHPVPITTEVTR